ncbi:hypothetical protein [Lignipirellula cremea]|uniref:DUF1772 domain-containing protein n=1 Tax=Lignipirellula cremea TaxID=2528010 RepID=A0A518DS44_9BACT|nr:hypothetical protein [Lignipirellula cremea]QDU94656.1 hypothetical protein Pla8534_24620 [Lignipirellula cremea]
MPPESLPPGDVDIAGAGLHALATIHLGLTCSMTGIMWFVQLAYYPNLRVVGAENYETYEQEHIRRINRVAWSMLAAELATSLALAVLPCAVWLRTVWVINLLLLLVIWWSTWFVQVPLHHALSKQFSDELLDRLVRTNWLRTVCYSLRTALLLGLFYMWLEYFPAAMASP